jgi:hypothetical protein
MKKYILFAVLSGLSLNAFSEMQRFFDGTAEVRVDSQQSIRMTVSGDAAKVLYDRLKTAGASTSECEPLSISYVSGKDIQCLYNSELSIYACSLFVDNQGDAKLPQANCISPSMGVKN